MRIVFDLAKDRQNQAKHRLSLAFANELEWDEALVWVDNRFSYDELRMVALVPAGNRLYYTSFVDRGVVYRIISLRYATRRELTHYVQSYP
jgi:uncharacterized DUF497 family protein